MNSTTRPLDPTSRDLLLDVALNLTTSSPHDRYPHLIDAMRRALPCDAAALLRLEGDDLVVLASFGLTHTAHAQRFSIHEHPRLRLITSAPGPTSFPPDSPLPDPFDGLLADDPAALDHVHACFGCPLRIEGTLVGVLTADARAPGAFDDLDPHLLALLGALAAATLHTTQLMEALELQAARSGDVASDLMREVRHRSGDLLGSSPPIRHLRDEIALVAPSDMTVLITGETGTGKELVARALHDASSRRQAPLIYVNCAALPEAVAESELFGHLRGAFTGAHRDRPGKFDVAHLGTLFLDEVGELSPRLQALLLRALQAGEIQRVGADTPHRVDARVLAATNRDLDAEVAAGRFRADLFHRLAVYRVHTPPLRQHPEDIPALAGHFADLSRRRLGLGPVRWDHSALSALSAWSWPGNVRELENVVSRAVLCASRRTPRPEPVLITPGDLAIHSGPTPNSSPEPTPALPGRPLRDAVDDYKRSLVQHALDAHGGSWAAAARTLGVHRSNLHHLAKRLGVQPS